MKPETVGVAGEPSFLFATKISRLGVEPEGLSFSSFTSSRTRLLRFSSDCAVGFGGGGLCGDNSFNCDKVAVEVAQDWETTLEASFDVVEEAT